MYLCNEYEDNRIEYIWLKVRCTNKIFYFSCVNCPSNSENEFYQIKRKCVKGKI